MTAKPPETPSDADDGRIACELDGVRVHSIARHLAEAHPGHTLEAYREAYPDAPLLSVTALAAIKAAKAAKAPPRPTRRPLHEIFDVDPKGFRSTASGSPGPIMLSMGRADLDETSRALVPDVDPAYVFDREILRSACIAAEMGLPFYVWGYHGTGKTSLHEQVAARLGRPFLRVQHTENTEESHVLGQWTVRDGSTVWQPGPLMAAMLEGWTYCADEYDFALPSVLAVYQPVLEGKPLVVKEAPPEFRVVRAHPEFRMVGTGNTNGGGDETGLYQGTRLQNAANYSRWTLTEQVDYLPAAVETEILVRRLSVEPGVAKRFVDFAGEIRKAFAAGKVSATISPRELIACCDQGLLRGGDYRSGVRVGFANRLSRVDRLVADQLAQRIFG